MRKIILLLAAGLLLLAGCSDIVQQENDTDSSSGGAAGAFLRVTAETEGFGARKEEASARTALPTIDGSAVTDSFTYTLKGTKEGGSEETLVSGVSLAKLKESLIPVTTGKWSFTLKAEKDGTVFTGTLSDKTITAGDNELSFTISWDESSLSGKGSLAFSLDWSKAGLNSVEEAAGTLFAYNPKTGTETETDYTESSGGITLDKDAHTVTYSLSDVPAGVYMIKISFYSDAEKTKLAGTWRELAVITGGQESGASRVMDVFVKHTATIDPIKDGGLSGIMQKTSSVDGIVTLAENTDGTYTLTSQGMGTSVLTFSETKEGESVAVTYNVSVSDTGELTVGSPEVKTVCTVTFDKNSDEVTGEMPAVLVEKGTDYTIKANKFSLSGYKFAGWATSSDGAKAYDDGATITKVTENLTLYALWAESYSVTVAGGIEHGTVTAEPGSAVAGETVTLTVTPETGYAGSIAIKNASDEDISSSVSLSQDSEDTTKWTFIMPEGTVTVSAIFEDTTPFTTTLKIGSGINQILKSLSSSAKQFKKSSTRNASATGYGYLDLNNKIPVWYDSSSETIYYYIPASCTSVMMNENSSYMFNEMKYLTSIEINGFDTSSVTNMNGMFSNTALKSLDLGDSFDTSNVTMMVAMFGNCTALESLDLSSFDTSKVTTMYFMFSGCTSLTSLDLGDSFDTGNVTTMQGMFYGCSALESLDLSSFINTSSVTNMSQMFAACTALKSLDLSSFNTSSVTEMSSMFANCTALTSPDVDGFDTSKVTDMRYMFSGCKGLTSLDLSSFDTSNVTYMKEMFSYCSALTTIYATDKFVTTSVTSGEYCFNQCSNLEGGAGTAYDGSEVHATYARIDGGESAPGYFTAKATAIGIKSKPDAVGDIVFSDGSATPYTADLTLTEEQKAAAVAVIFYVGTGLNSGDDTTTSRTLGVGLAQNQSGIAWCVSGAKAFSRDITTIQCPASGSAGSLTFTGDRNGSDNLSQISDFLHSESITDDTASEASYPVFYFAKNYKSQTGSRVSGTDYESGWYLPSIAELFQIWTKRTDLNKAIALCAGTEFDLSRLYWSSSQYTPNATFAYFLNFSDGNWGHGTKYATGGCVCAVRAFSGADAPKATAVTTTLKTGLEIKAILNTLQNLTITKFVRSETNNADATAYLDIDEEKIPVWRDDTVVYYYVPDGTTVYMNENSSNMFSECTSLTDIDIDGFDTSNVTDMSYMFMNCSALTSLNLSSFDTKKVTNMLAMFGGCSKLESLDLNYLDTSSVTTMNSMFNGCSALKSLDLRTFDTSAVTDMSHMFYRCYVLESLYLSSFDTDSVTTMNSMFFECKKLQSLDLSSFDTRNVTDMNDMFSSCLSLTQLDLSSFDTGSVTNMHGMFNGCFSFTVTELDLSSFDTGSVTNMANMFAGCSRLTKIYASNKFVTTSVTSDDYCFYGCTCLVGGAGTAYFSLNTSSTYARIDGGTDAPGYFTAKPIGSKSKPDAVGDIVFNDGSATPYTADLTLTDEQKAAAIAVIFDADKKLGVGLVQGTGLMWAKDTTAGCDNTIATLLATKTVGSDAGYAGDTDDAVFSGAGASDGSGSLEKFRTAVSAGTDALSSDDYPAWAWIEGYAATANLTGTSYASGWYMPSIKELCDLYNAKAAVNNSINKTDKTQMSTSNWYWSSSQSASFSSGAWVVLFGSGRLVSHGKTQYDSVCAVRAFN